MVFSSNPLALSVPDPAFESWLRDKGYLQILDQRTSELHRIAASAATEPRSSGGQDAPSTATPNVIPFVALYSYLRTLLSLFTINPFAKLTGEDFSGETPPWTAAFFGSFDSYSFPTSPDQARLRTHENVKRLARNYACLFILFLACSLYQMPIALVGLVMSLALWDAFKYCGDHWKLEQYPVVRQTLVRVAQCATAIILYFSNVQVAIFYALAVSYAVSVLHASFRKLTPAKPSHPGNRNKRISKKRG